MSAREYYEANEDGEGYAEYRASFDDPEWGAERAADDYERFLDRMWE